MLPIKIHTSWFGSTGYAAHARGFVRSLIKLFPDLLVRSFTSPEDYPDPPVSEGDKSFLSERTLNNSNGTTSSHPFPWNERILDDNGDKIHIILQPTNHPYYFEEYKGVKIAYNVWETTRQPEDFFKKLLEFDQVWVPTTWQQECLIKQGYPKSKIFIVNEGIDEDLFTTPFKKIYSDDRFRFMIFGKWEYRKSTEEIIRAFLYEFSQDEPVDLLVSADNPFASDNLKTTEEKLIFFNIRENQVKPIKFSSRERYINYLKNGHVLVSCSRGEGWGIVQLESIALGIPTIFSNYGAQLEYGQNSKLKVNTYGNELACLSKETQQLPGEWCSPDFEHLQCLMRDCYNNYKHHKKEAVNFSNQVNKRFVWDNAAKQARDALSVLFPKNCGVLFVTAGDENFIPIINKLVKSIGLFSKHQIVVYGVNHLPSIKGAECKQLVFNYQDKIDTWYLKQKACIQAINDFPETTLFVWIDGDSIVNENIDNVQKYSTKLLNFPLCDKHVFNQYYTFFYTNKDRPAQRTYFNEYLIDFFNIKRNSQFLGHACFFLFNRDCKWFFEEIIDTYAQLKNQKKNGLCVWNDEGIHNLLMWKYNFKDFLPQSNFETGFNPDRINDFFKMDGPFNFNEDRGWNFIPEDKNQVLYFHGNKSPEHAERIINLILEHNLTEKTFFTPDGVRNFKHLDLIGPVWEVADKYDWYAAIYHEVYNVHEYDSIPEVKVNKGDFVLDLGANFGVFSRYALTRGATVCSVEPDPHYFSYLKKNTWNKCVYFNCGIWSTNDTQLFYQTSHIGGSTFFQTDNYLNKILVNCFTLDHFFSAGLLSKIDFLKIDTEGAELEIFQGINDDNLLKINKMAIEFHCGLWLDGERKREELLQRFINLGFKVYTLFMGGNNKLQMLYVWK